MRNGFFLALVFTIAVLVWSSADKDVFGHQVAVRKVMRPNGRCPEACPAPGQATRGV